MTKAVTKSQRIRNYFSEHPDADANDAFKALKKHGVTKQSIYGVRSAMKKERTSQPKSRAKVTASSSPQVNGSGSSQPKVAEDTDIDWAKVRSGVSAARSFIKQVGDPKAAREFLEIASG